MRWRALTSLIFPALALNLACEPVGEPTEYLKLNARAKVLREAFNADVAKVRVLILASPT